MVVNVLSEATSVVPIEYKLGARKLIYYYDEPGQMIAHIIRLDFSIFHLFISIIIIIIILYFLLNCMRNLSAEILMSIWTIEH